jgi:type IV secretory pathway VirB3-like protein
VILKPVDWGGVAPVTTALLLLIVPLLEARELGWPLWMIGCLFAAFPMFGLFVWYERRFARRSGRAWSASSYSPVRASRSACRSPRFSWRTLPATCLF